MDNSSNNKRIAKNTAFLYVRMFFLLIITLYTSRVVLDKLGVEDFGVYNIVGGVASLFVFFSSALANASQRFLCIEIGRKSEVGGRLVFNQHLLIYIAFFVLVLIVSQTIGLWFVSNQLIIPEHRLNAALWVYEFTIASLCFTLLGVIFNALIMAHEDMKVYSYVGVADGVLKLLIAFAISITGNDRLITYSFLLCIQTFCIQSFYACYCFKQYTECRLCLYPNRTVIKETTGFIGWNIAGTMVYAVNDQGLNILLNIFFGPLVNAARGVSLQVNGAVFTLCQNVFTAVRPQIVKSYVAEELEYLKMLIFSISRYSFYLLSLICIPLMFCLETVLSVWLKEVPELTAQFTRWILAYSLVNILTNPIWTLSMAIGNLRQYIIKGSIISLLAFPIAYVAFKMGAPAVTVFIVLFIIRCVYLVATVNVVKGYIKFTFSEYALGVLFPCLKIFILCFLIAWGLYYFLDDSMLGEMIFCILSVLSIMGVIWAIGLSANERNKLVSLVRNKING